MSTIDFVTVLVKQLCETDSNRDDLVADALYDSLNKPNTSLQEKHEILTMIEKNIKHIAEYVGYFDEEDFSISISEKDEFALYTLLVARRHLVDQMMGYPSKNYVKRVSRQSKKLSFLIAKCLEQGHKMWKAITSTPSFESKNGYLQYGDFTLFYKADSSQAVLTLEDDKKYGSDFRFIHRLIYTLGEQTNMFDNNLMDKRLILNALADKDWTAEDLPSEVTEWYESALFSQAFKDVRICPAILALHCSLPYSIPDIVRMNNFVCNTSVSCEKSFLLMSQGRHMGE